MQYITLKHTDLKVSRACLGTMTFGGQADEATSRRITEQALEAGINFFDTANIYNQGTAEVFLGRALGAQRKDIVLASKVRGKMGDAADEQGLSRAAMVKACEDSLRRLGTDYLDLYYLHMPDRAAPIEETLATMEELVRAGKVRYPASSNYASWRMVEMLDIAKERGYKPITLAQPMYNLLARAIEEEYLEMSARYGISNIVYNPLAGGLLTGKQQAGAPLPGTRFDNNQLYLDRYWHADFFAAVEELKPLAARENRSLLALSLAWLVHHTTIDCIILGASKPEQLSESLAAMAGPALATETIGELDRIWRGLRGVTPRYHR